MIKIRKIFEVGVYPEKEKEHKKVKLLNTFCVTWFLFIILFLINDYYSGVFKENIVFHAVTILSIFIILFLHKKKKYLGARIVFISITISATFLFANIALPSEMMEILYFLYPLVALVLIDKRWVSLSIMVVCYFLYNYSFIIGKNIYTEGIINPTLSFAVFVGSYVILNYSQSLNKKSEDALKENQQNLKLAYEELEESKKKEVAHLQLHSLKSQMNPHFIFNALNSIQEYIVLNQKRLASDYLGKFSDLIRTYLEHSLLSHISLEEEINCLDMYLELEKLRFEDKFSYNINYSSSIELDTILIPTMLVQPYVENALKHGLLHKKESGNLMIDFKIDDIGKVIYCSVTDDGVGRDKANKIRSKRFPGHKSFASKATEDRLNLININLEGKSQKAKVSIVDLYDNNTAVGTRVDIVIPYKL